MSTDIHTGEERRGEERRGEKYDGWRQGARRRNYLGKKAFLLAFLDLKGACTGNKNTTPFFADGADNRQRPPNRTSSCAYKEAAGLKNSPCEDSC